jgi:hypothetical protein
LNLVISIVSYSAHPVEQGLWMAALSTESVAQLGFLVHLAGMMALDLRLVRTPASRLVRPISWVAPTAQHLGSNAEHVAADQVGWSFRPRLLSARSQPAQYCNLLNTLKTTPVRQTSGKDNPVGVGLLLSVLFSAVTGRIAFFAGVLAAQQDLAVPAPRLQLPMFYGSYW